MAIPVPIPSTPLEVTTTDNSAVEDFVAKLSQVIQNGTQGVTVGAKPAASPTLTPIANELQPVSMASETNQLFFRQLGFALAKSSLIPTSGGGGGGTTIINNPTVDMPDATPALRGAINTAPQTLAGVKTFQDGIVAQGASTFSQTATFVQPATFQDKVTAKAVVVANLTTNVKAYGAVGDGVTDDLAAFNAAIAASGTGSNGSTIEVPNGIYYLSGPLHINKAVILKGPTPQRYGTASCQLKFPAGSDGVILEASFSGTSGANAAIKCLTILAAGKTSAAYGVRFLQTGLVENCYISGWKTNGIIVDSTVGGSNCNSFVVRDTAVDACDGDGVRITGADSNQGILQHVSSRSNAGWGFNDTSLTSSTYLNCHTETNGTGSYRLSNSGAGGVLVNCYAEGGQPAPEVHPPAVIVGGTWGTANPYDASLYVSKVSPTYGLRLGGGGGANGSIVETPILGSNFVTTTALDLTVSFMYPFIAANTTATATPAFSGGTAGQRVTLYNNTIYTVTLQDNATLPGSGLTLHTPTVTLSNGDSINFICLGGATSWIETGRTIRNASNTTAGIVSTTTQTLAGAKTFQDGALAPVPFNPGGTTSPIITLDHEDYIRPESYGAVGDGVTDDYVALQAAINAAVTAKKVLRLRAKTYCTSQELVTTSVNHFAMVGAPMVNGVASIIKAIAPMRAVFLCKLITRISQVAFDGGGQAQCCLYLHECSLANFDHISVGSALVDGIFVSGEKDSTHFCSSTIDLNTLRFLRAGPMIVRSADRSPQTGTCSVTSGGLTVTFSGAPDLTTLSPSIAGGRIIIKNGTSNVFFGVVQSCTSNTVTLPAGTGPTFTASGCEYVLCQGLGSINDTNSFYNVGGGGCGTFWSSSSVFGEYTVISGIARNSVAATTVSVTSGASLVTFTGGGMDLWAANIREGDLMFIGDGAQRRMVMVAAAPSTPTTVYVDTVFDYTASGLSWAIGHGAGYHEARNSDANINSFSGTALWRGIAGAAMEFAGFYGPKVDGYQIDYCGMAGMRVGLSVCIGAILNRTYIESCGPQAGGVANSAWTKGIYLSSVQGILINMPLNGGNSLAENVQYSAMSTSGIYTGRYGQEPIGSFTTSVPATTLLYPVVSGSLTLGVQSIALNHPHTTTLVLTGNIVNLDAGVVDTTVTATPLLSGPQGFYVLRMHLAGTASVTFAGAGAPGTANSGPETYFQGSNVFFAAPCTLRAGDYILLYGDSTRFFEVARGNRSNPLHDYGTAAPIAGYHQIGEIIFNSSPTIGSVVGWMCTATGTPGTWQQFGTVGTGGASVPSSISSGLGAGATDLVTSIGSTASDGSMHATAKLTTWRTGLGGGSEVEKAYMRAGGGAASGNLVLGANGIEYGSWVYGAVNGGFLYFPAAAMLVMTNPNGAAYLGLSLGTGLASCSGTFQAGASLFGACLGVGANGVAGTITDTTASPGNATITAGKGRAALANGATSVVITNAYVTTNSVVTPIWEDDPGQPWTLTVAAGSFTITTSAAVAGNKKFRFVVVQ